MKMSTDADAKRFATRPNPREARGCRSWCARSADRRSLTRTRSGRLHARLEDSLLEGAVKPRNVRRRDLPRRRRSLACRPPPARRVSARSGAQVSRCTGRPSNSSMSAMAASKSRCAKSDNAVQPRALRRRGAARGRVGFGELDPSQPFQCHRREAVLVLRSRRGFRRSRFLGSIPWSRRRRSACQSPRCVSAGVSPLTRDSRLPRG